MSTGNWKQVLSRMSKPKRIIWLILVVWTTVMIPVSTIWFFSLHGTYALFKWTPVMWVILVIFGIVTVGTPLVSYLDLRKAVRKETSGYSPRRMLWAFVIAGIIIPGFLFGYFGTVPLQRAGDKPPQLLVVDRTGGNGVPDMAVGFWTQAKTKNTLTWGPGALTSTLEETKPTSQHAFVLSDLLPDTEYWYQINGKGDIYKFMTPSATPDTFHFAVSSDCHFGRAASRNDITIDILEQVTDPTNDYDMFFFTGDFVEMGWLDSNWKLGLDAISPYTSKISFRPTIGNHDNFCGGTQFYEEYFYPSPMPSESGSRLYYRFDVGTVHVFMLDLEWGTESYTAAQKKWFETELATVPKDDWTIVMSHCMYYSSGIKLLGMEWYDQKDMIDTFAALFVEHDVDLVFSGHNHHAEILQKDGVTYSVVGTFGGHPDPEREYTSPASLWYKNNQFGFMDVNIAGNTATLTFRDPTNAPLYNIAVSK